MLETKGQATRRLGKDKMPRFIIEVEELNKAQYEINADDEDDARDQFWDLIDRFGLEDERTEYGDITIVNVTQEATHDQ